MRESTVELLEFLERSIGGGNTGSRIAGVKIGDIVIPQWVIRRAPFKAREANAIINDWRLDDNRGYSIALGLDEAEARRRAEDLNTLVAMAIMVKQS